MDDALTDRRQRARETYHDSWSALGIERVEAAIEVATQVKITDDIIDVFAKAWHEAPQDGPPGTRRLDGLKAAFRAAGFEVVE